jgi:hypothetical protein
LAIFEARETSMVKQPGWAIAAALFMLAEPAFAVKKPRHILNLSTTVYLSAEFDAATTYHLLHNCASNCYEADPMVRPFARNPGIFVALGASAYAVNYLAGRLKSSGHPKWATALRVISIGAHTSAAAQALAHD